MIRKSSDKGADVEHHSADSGVLVGVDITVGVEVAEMTVGVGVLVEREAGSNVGGSVVDCIPQADNRNKKVDKRYTLFTVHNYSLV